MSRRNKHLSFVILAQFGCVGIGLWMQNRYVATSVYRSAVDETWQDLRLDGEALLSVLRENPSVDSLKNTFPALATTLLGKRHGAMITDAQGHVIARVPPSNQHNSTSPAPVSSIAWSASTEQSQHEGFSNAGSVELLDGQHFALAYPIGNSNFHLIVHHAASDVRARAAAATKTLPATAGMAMLWTCTLLSISVFMILVHFYDEMNSEKTQSEAKSLRRIESLVRTRDAVIFGLAKLADSRDPETGDHLDRIALYSSTLASVLHRRPERYGIVTLAFVRLIRISSALHDIGKVGIEDSILLKPGPLTDEERLRMQVHTTIGSDCLRDIERRLGSSNFLEMAREIALAHHERWDGAGYPYGLKGEEIPLSARIVAIADVYDALATKRVYKEAFSHEKCVRIIRDGAASQFDPQLVDVWLTVESRFRDIARQYTEIAIPEDAQATAETQPTMAKAAAET